MAVLEDVRIVDRVVAGARHYSLAVVDVQALRGKWARRLSGVDFAMESSLKAPGSAPADRIRAIAGALRRLAEKRSMEAQLRAIGGPLPPDTRDYAALFQEMQTLLKQVFPITLRSNDAEMTGLAAQALSDEWLVVAGAEQGVDAVVVDLQVTFRTQETASGVEILYTAQAEAVQNGHRLAGQNLADRLVHRDESTGKQKALLEIRDRLLKPFAAELSASILGDSPKEAGKEH